RALAEARRARHRGSHPGVNRGTEAAPCAHAGRRKGDGDGVLNHWVDTLVALQASGTPAVIVSVVGTRGSVPRTAGTHMIVTREELHGTIGGGHLEFQALSIARALLGGAPGTQRLRRFPLGASLGQCCGGVVNLLFEPIVADARWLATLLEIRNARIACAVVSPVGGSNCDKLIVTAQHVHGAVDVDVH